MTNIFPTDASNAFHCSPERPWGVHSGMAESACTHCGWSAHAPAALDDRKIESGLAGDE